MDVHLESIRRIDRCGRRPQPRPASPGEGFFRRSSGILQRRVCCEPVRQDEPEHPVKGEGAIEITHADADMIGTTTLFAALSVLDGTDRFVSSIEVAVECDREPLVAESCGIAPFGGCDGLEQTHPEEAFTWPIC